MLKVIVNYSTVIAIHAVPFVQSMLLWITPFELCHSGIHSYAYALNCYNNHRLYNRAHSSKCNCAMLNGNYRLDTWPGKYNKIYEKI